ncbi:SpoIID/LytB domain-containing protein [Falsibacillus pallidus]|uniref:SpoIID/LytB domain-containing protein n=1 Tax=Falsibacillus pallidus TaxID=493781 RepID=UPI003D989940
MNQYTKCFLSIAAALMLFTASPMEGQAAASPSPVTYKTEVKVKLLQTSTFSLTLTGGYDIVNLDTNASIALTSQKLNVSQASGKVTISDGKTNFTSAKGFNVNEITVSSDNEVLISKVQTSFGLSDVSFRGSFEIRPGASAPLVLNKLDVEDYLRGVVPSEMPASWPLEALKAQATAARSYAYTQMKQKKAVGYIEMTTASQVYNGKSQENSRTDQAVAETKDTYPLYNNVPIESFFYSSSGGYTLSSEYVWGNPIPYLIGVEDHYDNVTGNPQYGWEFLNYADKIAAKLGLTTNQQLLDLVITDQDPGKAVLAMDAKILDKISGTIDSVPMIPTYARYPDSFRSLFGITLKSTKFTVNSDSHAKIMLADGTVRDTNYLAGFKMQAADGSLKTIQTANVPVKTSTTTSYLPSYPESFTFTGNGYGHSLGMSQWGARGMAEAGFTYDQILKHYYTGIEIKKWP